MASEHCKLKTCEIKAKTTTKGQIISKGLFGFLEFSQSFLTSIKGNIWDIMDGL